MIMKEGQYRHMKIYMRPWVLFFRQTGRGLSPEWSGDD